MTDCYLGLPQLSACYCQIAHAACHCKIAMVDCYLGLPQFWVCHCQIATLQPVTAKLPRPIVKSYPAELQNCHIAACHLLIAYSG